MLSVPLKLVDNETKPLLTVLNPVDVKVDNEDTVLSTALRPVDVDVLND